MLYRGWGGSCIDGSFFSLGLYCYVYVRRKRRSLDECCEGVLCGHPVPGYSWTAVLLMYLQLFRDSYEICVFACVFVTINLVL
ncbi:hypothetical protein BO78DRAFT_90739 [Aspergillus sclerotiicarbonarius CBS 121057]|uniref:Uncharacterized protein n=1 Tax=Aspergillus sclerotiicarbonarius (strain CBS 121057 / IBT 28362) TaxID=1448318 RepID=A0A319EBI1_ASPSB|nr:hypothetical protein BO78DRAFT_90739 [Aspergillus sclerotiicarbonarius CBS 121057]